MKVVILAGGLGTRITEHSQYIPKPMIEIGSHPIMWHIMKEYSYYGFNEFIICAGYKQQCIKEFFANYFINNSDITFDMKNNDIMIHKTNGEPWKVTVVDTGLNTMTGGRIKRIQDYIGNETFLLTYGDGVCDINIKDLIKYHKSHKKICTLTSIQPGGRFGALTIEDNNIISNFVEKRKEDGGWINGGYMVLEPDVFDYIGGDDVFFEKEPLVKLAKDNQLVAYKYTGFWQCMDTLKDKQYLDDLITKNEALWMKWEDKYDK